MAPLGLVNLLLPYQPGLGWLVRVSRQVPPQFGPPGFSSWGCQPVTVVELQCSIFQAARRAHHDVLELEHSWRRGQGVEVELKS